MGVKSRLSRDQKRKAKLAERAKKRPVSESLAYSGTKYQADRWTPHVYQTELAVYETIVLSDRRLTNSQVEAAFIQLIGRLRAGLTAPLQEEEPEVIFVAGSEVEFLMWNIRRNWRILFQEQGPVSTGDWVGILRTLLNSIEAHAWNTGRHRGYVHFLQGFMQRVSLMR